MKYAFHSVVFGKYINGGFCSIPNWNAGCEIGTYDDVFWNTESLIKSLDDKDTSRAIAEAIREYA